MVKQNPLLIVKDFNQLKSVQELLENKKLNQEDLKLILSTFDFLEDKTSPTAKTASEVNKEHITVVCLLDGTEISRLVKSLY